MTDAPGPPGAGAPTPPDGPASPPAMRVGATQSPRSMAAVEVTLIRRALVQISASRVGAGPLSVRIASALGLTLPDGPRTAAAPFPRDVAKGPGDRDSPDPPAAGGDHRAGEPHEIGGLLAIGVAPARWLVVGPPEDAPSQTFQAVAAAVDGLGLATDQSDARVLFRVSGPGLAAAIERVLPLDLHSRAFPADGSAVTEAGGISVILWRDGPDALILAVPRSLEADMAALLDDAVRAVPPPHQASSTSTIPGTARSAPATWGDTR
ncbi:MAG TPA: hypothetical protein VMP03_10000 [Methylomirabilota bacterium]|nr:hypothetical protein [Methylomirabilota bacterium]